MKKFLMMGVLALASAAISTQEAPAWLNWKFGIGLNFGWQSGGNNTFWGLFRNGQPPAPDCCAGQGGGCGGGGNFGPGYGGFGPGGPGCPGGLPPGGPGLMGPMPPHGYNQPTDHGFNTADSQAATSISRPQSYANYRSPWYTQPVTFQYPYQLPYYGYGYFANYGTYR